MTSTAGKIRFYLTSADAWVKSAMSVAVGGAAGVVAQAGYDYYHLASLTGADLKHVELSAGIGAGMALLHRWFDAPVPPPAAPSVPPKGSR